MKHEFAVVKGVYPTMITPYRDGRIDEDAVRALVRWYWAVGCNGIFAACQSSEIRYLSVEERVLLVRLVVGTARELAAADQSRPPMMIVASGHVSEDLPAQADELCHIAAEGPDALILSAIGLTSQIPTMRHGLPMPRRCLKSCRPICRWGCMSVPSPTNGC